MTGRPLAGNWAQHWPDDLERLKRDRFASADQLLTLGLFCGPDPVIFEAARRMQLPSLTEFLGPVAPIVDAVKHLLRSDNIFNQA
jgi:5-methylthioadenosine/S-adenosylhomocysteine deaminase